MEISEHIYKIAGIPIVDLDSASASSTVLLSSSRRGPNATSIHFVNAYTYSLLSKDAKFAEIYKRSSLNFADGKPITWVARARGFRVRQVRGPSLFEQALLNDNGKEVRHFFLGGTPDLLEKLVVKLSVSNPRAKVAGTYSPPFRSMTVEDYAAQDACIIESGANLVWVGLGTPKQDFESFRIANQLGISAVAVGAAFDFYTEMKPEAPEIVRELGLEWLFRLSSEPKRLFKRYTLGNLQFIGHVLKRSSWN